ncbi:MAG: hypothetical protein RL240_1393 [Planctomycetota bacterium]|jgi:hypothetical protein
MMRKIADIPIVTYASTVDGVQMGCEPTRDEIQRAIDDKQFEQRGFQTHFDELQTEWESNVSSAQEWNERIRTYHTRRIAHFVVQGWTDPIILTAGGKMKDGLHRFKAAIFMGMVEVEVTISDEDSK